MTCPHLSYRRGTDGDGPTFDQPRAYCGVAERFVQPMRADICNDRYELDHAAHCEIFREHAGDAAGADDADGDGGADDADGDGGADDADGDGADGPVGGDDATGDDAATGDATDGDAVDAAEGADGDETGDAGGVP